MRVAHRGLGIRDLAVDALVQDLGKTQNEFKVLRASRRSWSLFSPQ